MSVGYETMRFLANCIATLRVTTEVHGQDFFLVPATKSWLFYFAVEETNKYRYMSRPSCERRSLRGIE